MVMVEVGEEGGQGRAGCSQQHSGKQTGKSWSCQGQGGQLAFVMAGHGTRVWVLQGDKEGLCYIRATLCSSISKGTTLISFQLK